jgi:hypothetical protein
MSIIIDPFKKLVYTIIKSIPTSKFQHSKPTRIQTSEYFTNWQGFDYVKSSSLFISLSIELCIPKNEVILWLDLVLGEIIKKGVSCTKVHFFHTIF